MLLDPLGITTPVSGFNGGVITTPDLSVITEHLLSPDAARRAVDSGHGAVEASRRNVEFGTGTEFDLLNAQNNYYAAQRAYSQSRYDYLTSVLTLKQQAGRLSERDLVAIDELLIETGS